MKHQTMWFIGVDVGSSGGLSVVDNQGRCVYAIKMPPDDLNIVVTFEMFKQAFIGARGCIEHVHSSPQMGVVSAFSFGGSYRALKMAMTAVRIPFEAVTPMKWQRRMECLSGGDKNVTKMRAQQLFPDIKITHAIADSLLIAEFCRRQYLDL